MACGPRALSLGRLPRLSCLALSLQPHPNRNGNVNRGQLLIRCSSCFCRHHGVQCWYSHPFAMALFSRLPIGFFKTNTRGRTLDNSWRQQEPKKIHCLPQKCFSLCLTRITKVKVTHAKRSGQDKHPYVQRVVPK